MAITLKDVASVAGVSTATVSRALAGSDKVSPRTANHVKEIADNLGYRFDNVARALRQKRSNLIGFLAPDFTRPQVHALLRALNRELYASELVLAAACSFASVQHEFAQVERLLGQRIDALLMMPVDEIHSGPAIDIALAEDTPVFQLGKAVARPRAASLCFDYHAGIACALRLLSDRDIHAPAYVDLGDGGQEKENALLLALEEHGIGPYRLGIEAVEQADLIVCGGYASSLAVSSALDELADCRPAPVILCLEKIPALARGFRPSMIALDFSMCALAGQLTRAINQRPHPHDQTRVQPYLDLSRFR